MKTHKMEFAALVLLLGTLCYAFYDCQIKGSEQDIVLSNELFTFREIKSKADITEEMLSIPLAKLVEEEENDEEKETEEKEEEERAKEETDSTTEIAVQEVISIPYNATLSNQIINYAMQFVGYPYVYGGNSLTNGTDCSGFTQIIYGTYGIYLPRSAPEQSYSGISVGLDNIMPGDLVFSGYDGVICHVSIYIGNGQLVHALNENVGIVVTNLYIMPILDVRRVI